MKYHTKEECRRKADQHWEMASLARQDGDDEDYIRQVNLAKEWDAKAADCDEN